MSPGERKRVRRDGLLKFRTVVCSWLLSCRVCGSGNENRLPEPSTQTHATLSGRQCISFDADGASKAC
jgi:hypothetical protein